jgi:hypothetical protein
MRVLVVVARDTRKPPPQIRRHHVGAAQQPRHLRNSAASQC